MTVDPVAKEPNATSDSRSQVVRVTVIVLYVASALSAIVAVASERPAVAVLAMLLTVCSLAVVSLDRSRRALPGPSRRWRRMLSLALLVMFALQSGTFLAQDTSVLSQGTIVGLPLAVATPFLLTSLLVLCWPTDWAPRQRNSAVVDGLVGILGLAVAWGVLVLPGLPGFSDVRVGIFSSVVAAAQLAMLALLVLLAAAAHRRSALTIVHLVLIQGALLLFVGGLVWQTAAAWLGSSGTLALLAYIASAGLLAVAGLRRANEVELPSQLWLRDAWSTVVPLSPVAVAAGSLLLLLASGRPDSVAGAVLIAVLLLGLIGTLIWLRTVAVSAIRKASVAADVSFLDEAVEQAWFQSFTANSREVVIVVDAAGRVVYASQSAYRLVGLAEGRLLGRDLADILVGLSQDRVGRAVELAVPGEPIPIDVTVESGDRGERELQFVVSSLSGMGTTGFVLTGTDVTDSRRLRAQLGESRRRDRLTGLLNRDAFIEALSDAQEWADSATLAVVVMDLFRFHESNDVRGHEVGDEILRGVAEILDRAAGPIIAVGRLSGDDFALLVHSSTPHVGAEIAVNQLRQELLSVPVLQHKPILMRAAFGYTTPLTASGSAGALVEEADLAAGLSARDPNLGLVRYEPRMREALVADMRLTDELHESLEAGDFVPHYQPIVDLRSGTVVGVEALVRRRLPDGSWQQPDVFIPLAERVGLVARVDSAVRRSALADLAVLHQGHPELTMAMNVSAVDFSESLVGEIALQISTAGVSASAVTIEITETAAAGSFAEAQEIFARLHSLGCRVAIDDFGTGYSALANLGALDVDVLKIDQSFLVGLSTSFKSLALLRGVVELGVGLKLTMVAEGVTSSEQRDLLRGMGCGLGQGFLFAPPLSFGELQDFLDPGAWRPREVLQ